MQEKVVVILKHDPKEGLIFRAVLLYVALLPPQGGFFKKIRHP
jgi:hypothetical protein